MIKAKDKSLPELVWKQQENKKMDAIVLRNMFCKECSLQFNKKIVFDLHLSLVHGKRTNIKQEPNNCKITSEDAKTKAIETGIISLIDHMQL